MSDLQKLTEQYNACVANGLVRQAMRINRMIIDLEAEEKNIVEIPMVTITVKRHEELLAKEAEYDYVLLNGYDLREE